MSILLTIINSMIPFLVELLLPKKPLTKNFLPILRSPVLVSNVKLSGLQKELLLWHWKLGISMYCIQKLIRPVLMNLLVFAMKCLLSSPPSSSPLQISRQLLFVSHVNWCTLFAICLKSTNQPILMRPRGSFVLRYL